VTYKVDDSSNAIGRRYARCALVHPRIVLCASTLTNHCSQAMQATRFLCSSADELGIPFAITVDFQTVKDNTATLRERDTTKPQIRTSVRTRLAVSKQELLDAEFGQSRL